MTRSTIYDRLRHKHVALTPEEGVRQWFVDYLIDSCGYPEGLMANEVALVTAGGRHRRCDTVVYDRFGRPAMIVEYKAPEVALTRRVFDQIARYNLELATRYLTVTNGKALYCCEILPDGAARFLEALPPYEALAGNAE